MLAHADTPDAMQQPHDEDERKQQPQPTYILDPITHDVWTVPARALLHDSRDPVYMEFDVFEQMGATGQLSGERLLHHDRAQALAFNARQVMAVRLKRQGVHAGGPALFAWATRMVTALPEEVFPDIEESTVGHEFLWLWPPGKAHNAYHTRRDRLRTAPALQSRPSPIDEIEPTCRYTPSVAGAMLGPKDIEGAVPVPFEELTPVQRFFVMCIKPQQTLFPRRPTADRWTQRVTTIIDQTQRAARQGSKWTLHNSVQCLLNRIDKEKSTPKTKTDKKRKSSAAPLTSGKACSAKRRIMCNSNGFHPFDDDATDEDPESSELSDVDEIMNDKVPWHRKVREEERARLWAQLPNELLVRILCMRIGDGLTNPNVDDALRCIFTMRSVSRGVLALVDSYVGVQIQTVGMDALGCLLDAQQSDKARSYVDVASRVRALGLGMPDVFLLEQHVVQLLCVPGWTLPKTPAVVPDWRWYFELRRETRHRHGTKTIVQRWPDRNAPSAELTELMHKHRHQEPHVWGSRFPAAGFGLDGDYDSMVIAAGECDIQDHMHALAGV